MLLKKTDFSGGMKTHPVSPRVPLTTPPWILWLPTNNPSESAASRTHWGNARSPQNITTVCLCFLGPQRVTDTGYLLYELRHELLPPVTLTFTTSFCSLLLVWGFPKNIMLKRVVPECSHVVCFRHVPAGVSDVFIYWRRHKKLLLLIQLKCVKRSCKSTT